MSKSATGINYKRVNHYNVNDAVAPADVTAAAGGKVGGIRQSETSCQERIRVHPGPGWIRHYYNDYYDVSITSTNRAIQDLREREREREILVVDGAVRHPLLTGAA